MLYPIIGAGLFFIILERLIPDQKLPHVKGWWTRVVIINAIQLGVLFLGKASWDKWLQSVTVFDFAADWNPIWGGLLAYFVTTFIFYWWHRWRHTVNTFWLLFHQVHHSPARIETITSFYKHPLEIIANSIVMGSINFLLLGLSLEAAGWCVFFTAVAEYVYHMNIATPQWLGYIFQRPEMHRIHHERGKHFSNFSDLPVWDMLFGTYKNPPTYQDDCGYKPEREAKLSDMLLFRNVNDPFPPKKP